MYRQKIDHRTLAKRLQEQSGCEFVTYADVAAVTGLTLRQCRTRLASLEGLHTRPKRFFADHAAQAIIRQ
jgi:hypothetical protein